jgi:hypothetical protein
MNSLCLQDLLSATGAVFGTALLTLGDAAGVEDAADDVITHSRYILYASTAHQDD